MKHCNTNINKSKRTFTSINIQIPQELFDDLQVLCQSHKMDFKDDLIARMAFSLECNDTLMLQDRLKRLIFCKELSYEYGQRRRKSS